MTGLAVGMTVFSFIATILFGICVIPQVVKTIKTKATSSLSLTLYVVLGFSAFIFMFYGMGQLVIPSDRINAANDSQRIWGYLIPGILIIICQILSWSSSFTIVFYKIRNMISAERLQLTEQEYEERFILNTNDKNKQDQNLVPRKLSFSDSTLLWKLVMTAVITIFALTILIFTIALIYANNSDWAWNYSEGPFAPHPIWAAMLGTTGSTLAILSFWNGIQKYYYTRDTSQLSVTMWLITIAGKLCICIYYFLGMVDGNWSLSFGLTFALDLASGFIALGLLSIKLKNIFKARKQGISEREYCQQLYQKFISKNAN